MNYEATRTKVIESGQWDGFYTGSFELAASGQSYIIQHEDRFYYIPKSKVITANDGWIWIPFSALESSERWMNAHGVYKYVGG